MNLPPAPPPPPPAPLSPPSILFPSIENSNISSFSSLTSLDNNTNSMIPSIIPSNGKIQETLLLEDTIHKGNINMNQQVLKETNNININNQITNDINDINKVKTLQEIENDSIKTNNSWNLYWDNELFSYLKKYSSDLCNKIKNVEESLNNIICLSHKTETKLNNSFNQFLILSNSQFIENRVYDEDETVNMQNNMKDKKEEINNTTLNTNKNEQKTLTLTNDSSKSTVETNDQSIISIYRQALDYGIQAMKLFVLYDDNNNNNISNNDNADNSNNNDLFQGEAIDIYNERPLPHIIGTSEFLQDDTLGLGAIPEEKNDNLNDDTDNEYSSSDASVSVSDSEESISEEDIIKNTNNSGIQIEVTDKIHNEELNNSFIKSRDNSMNEHEEIEKPNKNNWDKNINKSNEYDTIVHGTNTKEESIFNNNVNALFQEINQTKKKLRSDKDENNQVLNKKSLFDSDSDNDSDDEDDTSSETVIKQKVDQLPAKSKKYVKEINNSEKSFSTSEFDTYQKSNEDIDQPNIKVKFSGTTIPFLNQDKTDLSAFTNQLNKINNNKSSNVNNTEDGKKKKSPMTGSIFEASVEKETTNDLFDERLSSHNDLGRSSLVFDSNKNKNNITVPFRHFDGSETYSSSSLNIKKYNKKPIINNNVESKLPLSEKDNEDLSPLFGHQKIKSNTFSLFGEESKEVSSLFGDDLEVPKDKKSKEVKAYVKQTFPSLFGEDSTVKYDEKSLTSTQAPFSLFGETLKTVSKDDANDKNDNKNVHLTQQTNFADQIKSTINMQSSFNSYSGSKSISEIKENSNNITENNDTSANISTKNINVVKKKTPFAYSSLFGDDESSSDEERNLKKKDTTEYSLF